MKRIFLALATIFTLAIFGFTSSADAASIVAAATSVSSDGTAGCTSIIMPSFTLPTSSGLETANTRNITGNISVICTANMIYTITIDSGQNMDSQRNVVCGSTGATRHYKIVKGSLATGLEWGDAEGDGTYPASGLTTTSVTGGSTTHAFTAVLETGTGVGMTECPGGDVYSDTVTATLLF